MADCPSSAMQDLVLHEGANYEVRSTSGRGRAIFATKDIMPEEVIFTERPLVCAQYCWNEKYQYLSCEFCMKSLESPQEQLWRLTGDSTLTLPYPELYVTDKSSYVQCNRCGANYCSAACRDVALQEYHNVLCRDPTDEGHLLNHLEDLWRSCHFPPETTSITIVLKILARMLQSDFNEELISRLFDFTRSYTDPTGSLGHKLLGDHFAGQIEAFRELITKFFPQEQFKEYLSKDAFLQLWSMLGRNSQEIGTSTFCCWVDACDEADLPPEGKATLNAAIDGFYSMMEEVVGTFLNCEGTGLYSLQACLNHSCQPNAEVCFRDNCSQLSLAATCPIAAGEEIRISYLEVCALEHDSTAERRKELAENYLFICDCPRCQTS